MWKLGTAFYDFQKCPSSSPSSSTYRMFVTVNHNTTRSNRSCVFSSSNGPITLTSRLDSSTSFGDQEECFEIYCEA
jgi:hypothetical protein